MKYFILVAICMIAYCNCEELIDYRLSPLNNRNLREGSNEETVTTAPPPTLNCSETGAGLQCLDCDTVVYCLDMGGDFQQMLAGKCEEGEYCNNGKCSKEPNNQCGPLKDIEFKCTGVGMFPDPRNCQKYHICANNKDTEPLVKYSKECKNDAVYDMTRTYCSLKLGTNKQCPASTIVPTCVKEGTTFALANKSIFAMCVVEVKDSVRYLVPKLYVCQNGKIYNPLLFKCT